MTIDQETTLAQSSEAFDAEAAQALAGRFLGILNDAAVAMLTSVGHQTGLFETLAVLPAATSEQIADAADLNERYVREWLGGMTAARVVSYDPADRTYRLPREHAAVLTSAAVHDAALLEVILPLAPGLTERLRGGIDVADIGCGSGHAVNLMAQAFPASRFTGYDFSEQAIRTARAEAERLGLANVCFEVVDVATLDIEAGFDAVTAFDAIHDQAHPATVLSNIHRALRPGGVFLLVDIKASSNVEDNIDLPWGSYLYAISTVHCMSVSLGLGGDGLGTVWGGQLALSMLGDAGFGDVAAKDVEADLFNAYYVATK